MTEPKKLYRDPGRAVLGGVCAGLAAYLNVDVTVVRVVTVLIAIFTAFIPTALAYFILWLIMPPMPAATPPATVPSQPQQP